MLCSFFIYQTSSKMTSNPRRLGYPDVFAAAPVSAPTFFLSKNRLVRICGRKCGRNCSWLWQKVFVVDDDDDDDSVRGALLRLVGLDHHVWIGIRSSSGQQFPWFICSSFLAGSHCMDLGVAFVTCALQTQVISHSRGSGANGLKQFQMRGCRLFLHNMAAGLAGMPTNNCDYSSE